MIFMKKVAVCFFNELDYLPFDRLIKKCFTPSFTIRLKGKTRQYLQKVKRFIHK
jgi:hypothetical protein